MAWSQIPIWMLSDSSSTKKVFLTVGGTEKSWLYTATASVRAVTEVVIGPGKWAAAQGNSLCSGFQDSINIFGSQAPPGLEVLSLSCFEPSASRLCLVALMAVCVVEIGLELSKLILYVPSCSAPLSPTLSFVQKKRKD